MKNQKIETQKMLETLKQAVTEALDKKRRLGQYAVVWQKNRPVIIGHEKEKKHK